MTQSTHLHMKVHILHIDLTNYAKEHNEKQCIYTENLGHLIPVSSRTSLM